MFVYGFGILKTTGIKSKTRKQVVDIHP